MGSQRSRPGKSSDGIFTPRLWAIEHHEVRRVADHMGVRAHENRAERNGEQRLRPLPSSTVSDLTRGLRKRSGVACCQERRRSAPEAKAGVVSVPSGQSSNRRDERRESAGPCLQHGEHRPHAGKMPAASPLQNRIPGELVLLADLFRGREMREALMQRGAKSASRARP